MEKGPKNKLENGVLFVSLDFFLGHRLELFRNIDEFLISKFAPKRWEIKVSDVGISICNEVMLEHVERGEIGRGFGFCFVILCDFFI